MFLTRILGGKLNPGFYIPLKNTRTIRPCIKIGKEQYRLSLDVHQYKRDEIRVQAHPEYVLIEGKQEKNTPQGYFLKHFIRKFKLPEGCDSAKVETSLTPSGVLTVTAPRSYCGDCSPCHAIYIPITYAPDEKYMKKLDLPKPIQIPCIEYPKVKPCDN